jgi:hypothetical protein
MQPGVYGQVLVGHCFRTSGNFFQVLRDPNEAGPVILGEHVRSDSSRVPRCFAVSGLNLRRGRATEVRGGQQSQLDKKEIERRIHTYSDWIVLATRRPHRYGRSGRSALRDAERTSCPYCWTQHCQGHRCGWR